jgi:SAM-dependent methyltransferase
MMLKMGWRVYCIEPDTKMAEIARQKYMHSFAATKATDESDFKVFVGSLEEADLAAGDFDAVVFFDSLHHIPDETACFQTCHKALREGGLIAISEGAWIPGNAYLEKVLRDEMEQSGTLENPFTRSYLDHCLRRAGFSAIERFVWPQMLIHEDFANSPLSFGLLGMPESTNFLIATKNFVSVRREWDVEWNLHKASWDPARQILAVDVEIRNVGLHVWRAGPGPGEVTVGLRVSIAEHEIKEYPHAMLPRRVFAGETLNFRHEYAVGADGGTTDFVLDLVNEQRFWFSQLGCSVCSLGVPR